ncbi:tRNA-2-methylthio-N6-dimethylallyladenosine synthase, partial [Candidatus Hakubella thermalkaliphila]
MGKKFYIRTFGCQMNKHDSERIAGLLSECHFQETLEIGQAEVIIYNTCSVRENADNRLFGHLSQLASLKERKRSLKVVVAGCIAQKMKEDLLERSPHVDIVVGPNDLGALPHLIRMSEEKKARLCQARDKPQQEITSLPSKRKSAFKAWLPIMTGCNNFCSYCIVPYVRGREHSRPFEEVLTEAQELVNDGVVEITLLGQNVNSYHDGNGRGFFHLLEAVSQIEGVKRIRFATSHPKDLSPEVIDLIAQRENICNHIHLPLQSGSNRILSHMNRKYTREHFLHLASLIQERIPEVALSTDIIVGYLSEEEEDFWDTVDMLKKCRFDQAFIFEFSPRPGTTASMMEDRISKAEKQRRFRMVNDLQKEISWQKNRSYIGRCVTVLVEGRSKKDPGEIWGRTDNNKVVNFPGSSAQSHPPPAQIHSVPTSVAIFPHDSQPIGGGSCLARSCMDLLLA